MRTTLALCTLAACAPSTSESIGADTVGHVSQYSYDATGMPTDAPALPRDALGRATAVNGVALSYGPDGALARATHGADTFDYITDESGHRLAKRKNGAFVEAYVDEGVLSDALYTPVRFAGATVGIVHHGGFESVAADARGTLLADGAGVTRAAAFGERARASALASAIDYAQSGRDPDLGLVRMGVRDYDPTSHRFTTPDPLFLLHPEHCITDPVACNLYSYARDRPEDFVDPSGTKEAPYYLSNAAISSTDPSNGPVSEWTLSAQIAHNDENYARTGIWNDDRGVLDVLHARATSSSPPLFARVPSYQNDSQPRIGQGSRYPNRIDPFAAERRRADLAFNAGPIGLLAMVPMDGWLVLHPGSNIPDSFFDGLEVAGIGDTIAKGATSFGKLRTTMSGKQTTNQELWNRHERIRGLDNSAISTPYEGASCAIPPTNGQLR